VWGSITTTEAGMLTDTELIEFPNDFVEVLAEGTEDHREFTLLLFIVNKGPEERWNQMVLALAEQIHFYLLLLSQPLMGNREGSPALLLRPLAMSLLSASFLKCF
jgi:hypothetical protein